eukprot:30845-Pelagococcus_subviridis.AAC.1
MEGTRRADLAPHSRANDARPARARRPGSGSRARHTSLANARVSPSRVVMSASGVLALSACASPIFNRAHGSSRSDERRASPAVGATRRATLSSRVQTRALSASMRAVSRVSKSPRAATAPRANNANDVDAEAEAPAKDEAERAIDDDVSDVSSSAASSSSSTADTTNNIVPAVDEKPPPATNDDALDAATGGGGGDGGGGGSGDDEDRGDGDDSNGDDDDADERVDVEALKALAASTASWATEAAKRGADTAASWAADPTAAVSAQGGVWVAARALLGVNVLTFLALNSLRRVLYTGSHTTPFAWWTPFLKDFARRLSPPTPRFQYPPSTPFNSI